MCSTGVRHMEVVKQIFAILGTGIGVLSGVVTLYAKYLDMKKRSVGGESADVPPTPVGHEPRRGRPMIADGPSVEPGDVPRARRDRFEAPPLVQEVRSPSPVAAEARKLVRAPAIAMM